MDDDSTSNNHNENTTTTIHANTPIERHNTFWKIREMTALLNFSDYIVSSDLSVLWRRHLVWAKKDGDDLVSVVTGRFASTSTFLALLFGAEVGTYFSPSDICTQVRHALAKGPSRSSSNSSDLTYASPGVDNWLDYATGVALLASIIITGCAVFANYTAWGAFRGLSKKNAPIIFRSTVGLYAAQLPSRLTVIAIYSFFVWLVMFWWINFESHLTPGILTLILCLLIVHISTTFSALGRTIMATSAMGETPILPREQEDLLTPEQLSTVLLKEARLAQKVKTPVNRQYSGNYHSSTRGRGGGGSTSSSRAQELTYPESMQRRYPDLPAQHQEQHHNAVTSLSASTAL